MNALQLLKRLKDSGTGEGKLEQAREVARKAGKLLRNMSGAQLLDLMVKSQSLRRQLLSLGGEVREMKTAWPDEMRLSWPEGTIKKADRILRNLPAEEPNTTAPGELLDVDGLTEQGEAAPPPEVPEVDLSPKPPQPTRDESGDLVFHEVAPALQPAPEAAPEQPRKRARPARQPAPQPAHDDESNLPQPPE